MLKTEQLHQYLNQYQTLELHQDPALKQITLQIMQWQKQRMQNVHVMLFHHDAYQNIVPFFFNHFYHFDALELLAGQLQQALDEKIKLERWLPKEVLDTILNGFHLALLTLKADSELAQLLIARQLDVTTPNLLMVLPEAEQNTVRLEQLALLQTVSIKLYKFAHSFLLRSALKLAQGKIEQRGFTAILEYTQHGMEAMRSNTQSLSFFKQLIHQEKCFLNYLNQAHPQHLDVYYDGKTDSITFLTQVDQDGSTY